MSAVHRSWRVRSRVSLVVAAVVCLAGAISVHEARAASPDVRASLVMGGGAGSSGTSSDDTRPNIILITTDDQALADMWVMRRVRHELAHDGTTFGRAFSPYPLCCPARATILTGQYAHNNHVLGNEPPYGGFQAFDDSNTLPIWLQQAGYNTAIIGKYLNGYPLKGQETYESPGWNDWRVPIKGIYNYRHWTLNVNGAIQRFSGEYQTQFVSDEATQIVDNFSAEDKPFFFWYGFLAPHDGLPIEPGDPPRTGTHRMRTPAISHHFTGRLAWVTLPDKPSINEADVSDKPAYIRRLHRRNVANLTSTYQQRLESLMSVDIAVSRLITTLEDDGELDNTVIIFTSDNGYLVGEHRYVGKIVGYEESTRVPLIISGPGFQTGQTLTQLVSLADLAPTIAQIAGVSPGLVEDGVPLSTFIDNPGQPSSRPILLQAGPMPGDTTRWYTGIRTNRYVYVEYDTGESELYDLKTDPYQLDNLAEQDQGTVLESRLRLALAALRNCAGESCQASYDELVAIGKAHRLEPQLP